MNDESRINDLRALVEIQGRDGSWNYDDYMCGLFNGLELALATLEGRDPQFRTLKPAAASTAKPALAALTRSPDLSEAKHQVNAQHAMAADRSAVGG